MMVPAGRISSRVVARVSVLADRHKTRVKNRGVRGMAGLLEELLAPCCRAGVGDLPHATGRRPRGMAGIGGSVCDFRPAVNGPHGSAESCWRLPGSMLVPGQERYIAQVAGRCRETGRLESR